MPNRRGLAGIILGVLACVGTAPVASAQPADPPAVCDANALNPYPLVMQHEHSHNDYDHSVPPLCSPLTYGVDSAEADVWWEGDVAGLVVSHVDPTTTDNPLMPFGAYYLDPLFARFQRYGAIYPEWHRPFLLWVEIKDEGTSACKPGETSKPCAAIHELYRELEYYRTQNMLTTVENGRVIERAVTVMVTGHVDPVAADPANVGWSGVQDLFVNLDERTFAHPALWNTPLSAAPVLNIKWPSVLPPVTLAADAFIAHQHGRKLRIWGGPDTAAARRQQMLAGVDYIGANATEVAGTDNIPETTSQLTDLGDGCGVGPCALGAETTATLTFDAEDIPTLSGTLRSLATGCARLEITYLSRTGDDLGDTDTQACGDQPQGWSVTGGGTRDAYGGVAVSVFSDQGLRQGVLVTYEVFHM